MKMWWTDMTQPGCRWPWNPRWNPVILFRTAIESASVRLGAFRLTLLGLRWLLECWQCLLQHLLLLSLLLLCGSVNRIFKRGQQKIRIDNYLMYLDFTANHFQWNCSNRRILIFIYWISIIVQFCSTKRSNCNSYTTTWSQFWQIVKY
jgi:hypothetical protein